jgi:hypothetical protein
MIHENVDPLAWWKTRKALYPLLATLARRVLAVPATSANAVRTGLVETMLSSLYGCDWRGYGSKSSKEQNTSVYLVRYLVFGSKCNIRVRDRFGTLILFQRSTYMGLTEDLSPQLMMKSWMRSTKALIKHSAQHTITCSYETHSEPTMIIHNSISKLILVTSGK